jgi:hypothetical protein
MKRIIFLIAILFATMYSYSQDRIIKKDKTEIKVKVLEVGDVEIKYKKEDNPDGPTYAIKKAEVNVIIYKNGQVESFNEVVNTQAVTQPTKLNSTIINSNNNEVTNISVDKRYRFTLLNNSNKTIETNVRFKDMQQYVANDPQLLQSYNKHKTARTIQQVFGGVFSLFDIYVAYKSFSSLNNVNYKIPVAFYAILGVQLGVQFAIIMPNTKKTAKAFVNDFNKKKSNGVSLKIGFTNNGYGLALNF